MNSVKARRALVRSWPLGPATLARCSSRRALVLITLALAALTLLTLHRRPANPITTAVAQPRQAFVTLCTEERYVVPALVLFARLRALGTSRAQALLVPADASGKPELSREALALVTAAGVKVHPLPPAFNVSFAYVHNSRHGERPLSSRDHVLWRKLGVWALGDWYDKVVLVDADMVVARPVDSLFSYRELAGAAMIDPGEKIVFYNYTSDESAAAATPEAYWRQRYVSFARERASSDALAQLVNVYGLNSGVMVLEPSMATLRSMLAALPLLPQRPCCPTQEFLFRFFRYARAYSGPRQRAFVPLPAVYNARRWEYLDPSQRAALRDTWRIYHFVEHDKPWVRTPGRQGAPPQLAWIRAFCAAADFESVGRTAFRAIWWQHYCSLRDVIRQRRGSGALRTLDSLLLAF